MFGHIKVFVSHSGIWVMGFLSLATLVVIAPQLRNWSAWVAIACGIVLFYISEYTTHRFAFHSKPPKNPTMLKILKRLHYDHHEYPRDLHLLFLPLWYSIPNLTIAWLAAWAVTQNKMLALCVTTGVSVSLIYYEWAHFVAHRSIIPRTRWGKWMKKYHLWHHYKNEHYWFGVTNPGMDFVGRTYVDVNAIELSPTVRKLYDEHDTGLGDVSG